MSNDIYASKKWIIENCFVKAGTRISSNACKRQWWEKRDKANLYEEIKKSTDSGYSFGYRILLFLSSLYTKECIECGEPVYNWLNITCSKECLYKGKHRSKMTTSWRQDTEKAMEVCQKIKSTKEERYGDPNYNNRQKAAETLQTVYGINNPLQLDSVKEKVKITCNQKYGANSYGSSEEGRKRISKIRKEAFQQSLSKETKEVINDKDNIKELYKKYKSAQAIADSLGLSKSYILNILHSYGIDIEYCNGVSSFEESVFLFLKEHYKGTIIRNDRSITSPREIDIYIPEKKIAIECNGIYWHSEQKGKDKNYHISKTTSCEENGIQLFHIYDTEWSSDDKWQSVLLNALNIHRSRIGARQCIIKMVSSKEARAFCDDNHLQGSSNSPINYGLFYKDELVSVMTFSKARFSKADWELQRFCSKKYHIIHGAASKLLKAFKKDYAGTIVSYANRRWSVGNLYESLKFTYMHNSTPNYFYFKNNGLESRNKYQKHKLKGMDNYTDTLTEAQIMSLNDFYRIWDSGNKVYINK